MLDDSIIDVLEDDIEETDRSLLAILLMNRTTRKNILWGTDDYSALGEDYGANKEIYIELITGANSKVIQPRVLKAQAKQQGRTRDKAEVFTPPGSAMSRTTWWTISGLVEAVCSTHQANKSGRPRRDK